MSYLSFQHIYSLLWLGQFLYLSSQIANGDLVRMDSLTIGTSALLKIGDVHLSGRQLLYGFVVILLQTASAWEIQNLIL